jgi:hypothetical protein
MACHEMQPSMDWLTCLITSRCVRSCCLAGKGHAFTMHARVRSCAWCSSGPAQRFHESFSCCITLKGNPVPRPRCGPPTTPSIHGTVCCLFVRHKGRNERSAAKQVRGHNAQPEQQIPSSCSAGNFVTAACMTARARLHAEEVVKTASAGHGEVMRPPAASAAPQPLAGSGGGSL